MEESEPVVRIPVHKGDEVVAYALVDEQNAHFAQWHWKQDRDGYALRKSYGRRYVMHRVVLGLKTGDNLLGDHINRNRLDNRLENLRVVDRAGNSQNRCVHKTSRSGIRGVHWNHGKWSASVKHKGVTLHLGSFATAQEAGKAAENKRAELGFLGSVPEKG